MAAYLTQIAKYLEAQSWQIAALVVVIATAAFALKNRSAHLRYLLWLVVLAKCLVPPLLSVPVAVFPGKVLSPGAAPALPEGPIVVSPTAIEEPSRGPERIRPEAGLSSAPPAAVPARLTVKERSPALRVRQWLAIAWLGGAAVFIGAVVTKALRTRLWLRRERKRLPPARQGWMSRLFSELGLKRRPKVWLVEGIRQPFVWGMLRGNIHLPADFTRLQKDEHLRGVIAHELSHILRFDAGVNLLQVIAQAPYWFHPLVWWANRRIRAEREKCCDEIAISRLNALPKDYGSAIVNALSAEQEPWKHAPWLAVVGPLKNVEERIRTIMKPGKRFHRRPSLIAAAVTFALAVVTVPIALVPRGYGQAEPPETEVFRFGIPLPGVSGLDEGSGVKATPGPEARPVRGREQRIKSFLLDSGVPWPEGSNIAYDDKTGTLVVTNTPTNMVLIRELVRLWAAPAPQVEVEAKFVRVLPTFRLGGTPEGRMLSLLISSWTETSRRRGDFDPALSVRAILSQQDFELVWSILAEKDWCDLLFAPRVITIDGNRAMIDHERKQRDLGFRLEFTPSFSADGRTVSLALRTDVALAEGDSDGEAEAAPSTPAETVGCAATVDLRHEETAVLAGWMPDKTARTPADRPNLLVFITARIITPRSGLIATTVVE